MVYVNEHDGRRKIYVYEKEYNNFANITDEDLERIQKRIKIVFDNKKPNFVDAIKFLSRRNVHLVLPTYDERIAFLILAGDPNFLMHKMYLDSEIVSSVVINEALEEDRPKLIEKRNQQIRDFRENIRSKFGFYDGKLLTYESDLRRKLEKNKFVFDIKYDALSVLLDNAKNIKDFDSVTDQDLERLKVMGDRWFLEAPNPDDYNSLAYNLLKKYNLFGIKTSVEQILQFILLVDPDLQMLKISEEEYKEPYVSERCIKEIGFFNPELVRLERKYHDKFVPEMKISDWEK